MKEKIFIVKYTLKELKSLEFFCQGNGISVKTKDFYSLNKKCGSSKSFADLILSFTMLLMNQEGKSTFQNLADITDLFVKICNKLLCSLKIPKIKLHL